LEYLKYCYPSCLYNYSGNSVYTVLNMLFIVLVMVMRTRYEFHEVKCYLKIVVTQRVYTTPVNTTSTAYHVTCFKSYQIDNYKVFSEYEIILSFDKTHDLHVQDTQYNCPHYMMKVSLVLAVFMLHTFSLSYSAMHSSNWSWLKPLAMQRCLASSYLMVSPDPPLFSSLIIL